MASELDITNGHAARMRFSRFKQQMEGVVPQQRKPRETKKKEKPENSTKQSKKRKRNEQPQAEATADEAPGPIIGIEPTGPSTKAEPMVKSEPLVKSEPVVKSEPTVKEEPKEAELTTFPVAPCDTETPITPFLATQSSPDPLPGFFSTVEEIKTGPQLEATSPLQQTMKAEPMATIKSELEN